MKTTTYIFLFLLFCSCTKRRQDETKDDKTYPYIKRSKCYDNLQPDQHFEGYEYVKLNIYKRISDSTFHFATCNYAGESYLNQLSPEVNIESLEDLGQFLIDKNYVYHEYSTSDGILLFRLDSVDRSSFNVFPKSIYARDNYHIFDSRNGLLEGADVESFKAIYPSKMEGYSPYGRDKKNYYFWNRKIERNDTIEWKTKLGLK